MLRKKKTHTYIKRNGSWYLFDYVRNRKKTKFKDGEKHRLVYNINTREVFDDTSAKCLIVPSDCLVGCVNMFDYLRLSMSLKTSTNFRYNKKLGKLMQKKI